MFNKAFCLFNDHLGYSNVTLCWFVKCRGNNFALHGPLHVGHFFWPLINQQNDQIAFRVILFDRVRDVLQQDRFTSPRRRHDQRTLAFTNWGNKIDNPCRFVFDCWVFDFHPQTLIRVKRSQVIKGNLMLCPFRVFEVNCFDDSQRKITLCVVRFFNNPFNRIAGPQRMRTDHIGRDVNIIWSRQIVCFW